MPFMKGNDAIDYALIKRIPLRKFRDPLEDPCVLTVEEARRITREDPGLVYIQVDGQRVLSEMQRVFGAHVHCDWIGNRKVHVSLDGWPDWVTYDIVTALQVLGHFADRHGVSNEGDAEVCCALEDAGAVVDSR